VKKTIRQLWKAQEKKKIKQCTKERQIITSIPASLDMQRIDGSEIGPSVQILKSTNAETGAHDCLWCTAAEPYQVGIWQLIHLNIERITMADPQM